MAKRYRGGPWGLLVCASLLLSGAAYGQSGADRSPRPTRPPAPGAPNPPPAEQGKDGAGEDKPKAPTVTGGYSWGKGKASKRSPHRRRYRRVKYDPNAAHATFPGFRVLPDGSSLVWVVLDKRVDVDVRRARGRVTYVLKGAQVNIRNNTYPLVTTHFRTPLSQVRLVHHPEGAHLVLELREAINPAPQVVAGPRGMMVLKVRLPQPTRAYPVAAPRRPARSAGKSAN